MLLTDSDTMYSSEFFLYMAPEGASKVEYVSCDFWDSISQRYMPARELSLQKNQALVGTTLINAELLDSWSFLDFAR